MIDDKLKNIKRTVGVLAAGVLLVALAGAATASAEVECSSCRPWWRVSVGSFPRNLPPGGEGQLTVLAEDRGDAGLGGSPVVLRDRLPQGLAAQSVSIGLGMLSEPLLGGSFCDVEPHEVTCTIPEGLVSRFLNEAYSHFEAFVSVKVEGARSGEENEASISGGGAPSGSVQRPIVVDSAPTPFGVEQYELRAENADGSPDTQAGSHPFQLTTTIALNQATEAKRPPAAVKDLHFNLPPGLIGDPVPFPECPLAKFAADVGAGHDFCPDDTAVGVASVSISFPANPEVPATIAAPLFNLTPVYGEPARFGFEVLGVLVYLDTSVRTGGDYGVTVSVNNITEISGFISSRVTFWGVPGDPRHDSVRGWNCLQPAEVSSPCTAVGQESPPPLLSLPTSCTGPVHTSVEADSWQDPGAFNAPVEYIFQDNLGRPVGLDGCNHLLFSPSLEVAPDGHAASTPTGLSVGVRVPQETLLSAEGLAPPNVKDIAVTLPEGVQISPAGAGGLQACSQAQVALSGPGPSSCPEASKIGTVEITTPLLPEPVEGGVFLAEQNNNPFGSLVGMYLVAQNAKAGVVIKLAGEVALNPVSGQLVASFPNEPELPFEEAKLHFFGSDRAPLSTPPSCGAYTTMASVSPWSGNAPVAASSTFDITSGPDETGCASPRPFQPGFAAGSTNVQAGAYTPLTLTMSRPDADQTLAKLSIVFPPGVSAGLQGVKLCEEPQAAQGNCPAESQIGQAIASVGLGGDPFSVETGRAYITGPYEGDPFGVEIVVPAIAGPFNLGTEVVRSKVDVDPTDAHLTVVSNPFPTILDGIPLQLQHVNVTVNRPGFVFNPTSCEPMKLTGELQSTEGATADVGVPFQVTNCAALSFKPEFEASTSAKTSRMQGASLHVTLTLPGGARGTKANVAKVKVSLPKQLPSPLKTLQKACTEKVFAEDPSNCPVASKVGEATVGTPVLEGPLSGPAYFVSHGGAKYPELIMVLVGEDGVTVQVHGETFISKQGITSATFATVPDVPFSTFELTLPEREYPALTANGNLCKGSLSMPTELVGQNGVKIAQSTKISVTGCPKVRKTSHKRKKAGKHRVRGKRKR